MGNYKQLIKRVLVWILNPHIAPAIYPLLRRGATLQTAQLRGQRCRLRLSPPFELSERKRHYVVVILFKYLLFLAFHGHSQYNFWEKWKDKKLQKNK